MFRKVALAAAIMAVTSPAAAQVTGGSLGIEYSAPTDGGDFGGTTYSGSLEYAFNRNFALSFDISGYRLDNISTNASSVTVHGIYNLDEMTSFGVFYGADSVDSADAQALYGVEAGTEFGDADVEAFLGQLEGVSDDALVYGVDANYSFSNVLLQPQEFGHRTSDNLKVWKDAGRKLIKICLIKSLSTSVLC